MLVCFHDDMLDQHLEAYGDVADWPWEDLQRFRFRNPGRFGDQCRIPTLAEVFELHRRHAGLMHLDIKRPGLDRAIADLLTKMDMWDHVGYCNTDHGGVILKDERYKPRRYKGGLYQDRGEVFPDAIAAVLKKPGDGVIVDDPRGVAVALGRKLGKLSTEPVSRKPPLAPIVPEAEANPFAILEDDRGGQRPDPAPGPGGRPVAEPAGIGGGVYCCWRSGSATGPCTRSGCTTAWTGRRPCGR